MAKELPTSAEAFEALLERVDRDLAAMETPITHRPLEALRVISNEFETALPITPPVPGTADPNWPFAQRVLRWYEERYGDRLKMHFGPGRAVVLLRNAPWVIRLPRIYGQTGIVLSREGTARGNPRLCNPVDCIEAMALGFRASLSDAELGEIGSIFELGLDALQELEYHAARTLISSALADMSSSVDHIMARNPDFGLSRWSSLQCCEKVLKALIEAAGGSFRKTHDLAELVEHAGSAGIHLSVADLVQQVQCATGVRYGEVPASLAEAVTAHHAALGICRIVGRTLSKRPAA